MYCDDSMSRTHNRDASFFENQTEEKGKHCLLLTFMIPLWSPWLSPVHMQSKFLSHSFIHQDDLIQNSGKVSNSIIIWKMKAISLIGAMGRRSKGHLEVLICDSHRDRERAPVLAPLLPVHCGRAAHWLYRSVNRSVWPQKCGWKHKRDHDDMSNGYLMW